ncbi:MAG: hypothetical protein NT007_15150 [Candidatus Kapabacteria bacterium]|nr:hypothetical protein [Candidatus Kapabacteria bacterium]
MVLKYLKIIFCSGFLYYFIFLSNSNQLLCQNASVPYLSFGISYSGFWGKQGGSIVGFEASFIYINRLDPVYKYWGINADFAIISRNKFKTGISYEYQYGAIPGFTFGPSLIIDNGNILYGACAGSYLGAILYPYYNFSIYHEGTYLHELGVLFKVPLRIGAESMDLSLKNWIGTK